MNPGAIAAASLLPGETAEDRWRHALDGLSHFAGRALDLDGEVYASASATNHRNRALVRALHERGRVFCDPAASTCTRARARSRSRRATWRSWARRCQTAA